MAFLITSKQGTPIKSYNRLLINPKQTPEGTTGFQSFIPVPKVVSSLSIPESPTTTNLRQLNANIPTRHELLYPRTPDRGGDLPWAGIPRRLPNNAIGGKANRIQPQLQTLAKQTRNLGMLNRLKSDKLQAIIRKTAMSQSFNTKQYRVRITPTAGGLDYARAPRRFIDAITGKLKMRSAVPIIRRKAFGVFSQHRTAPAATVGRLAFKSAQKRNSLIEPQMQMIERGSKSDSENKRPMTVARVDEMTTIAVPVATEIVKEENRGFERFFLLAAVAVIGFMALRNG